MINLDRSNIKKLNKLLTDKKKITIITHVNPDGDAIGSSLGLYHFLINIGHEVYIITPNDYPEFLHWLPGNNNVIKFFNKKSKSEKIINDSDLIFALDFNHIDRIDKLETYYQKSEAIKILIDHHPDPQQLADITFSYTNVSSTAELVFLIIQELGAVSKITKESATCLYTGIMTDTGCFNYNCSNPSTFKTASELIEFGIDINNISTSVYDNYSMDRMKLMGYSLNEKMKVYPEYRTAIITLTKDELTKFNFKPGDTEGFVNLPLSIKEMVFSVFIIEKKDHVKLSFRSIGNFAANKFAVNHFNGGGHLNAAGGQTSLNLNETISEIEKLLRKYSKQLNNAL